MKQCQALKSSLDDDKINSIYNIRFVTSSDNKTKSAIPYEDWVISLNNRKDDVFLKHSIPAGGWSINNFDDFLKNRKKEMIKHFNY